MKKRAITNVKIQNNKKMLSMVTAMLHVIQKQGTGCSIEGYGAAYINHKNSTRDPIGAVLSYSDIRGFHGIISSEAQKPLVSKLVKKYSIDQNHESERCRFVNILTRIQDLHDSIFDRMNKNYIYDTVSNLEDFTIGMNILKKELSV